ncbi:MAG: nucleotidyltransferase family protein [Verrucomicrobia bacterium]|nr:nucleotidyltransferase family protein [Verrucomicrobiota bacterium]
MNALILAAGYATRLYPLTKDFPKPLLDVGERTILDHLVDQMDGIVALKRIVLITNRRFRPLFENWRAGRRGGKPVEILDDGTTSNEERLGAIGDLRFALEHSDLDDDLLVAAADNILRFPLAEFVAAFLARPASHLGVHHIEDMERLRRTGVAVLDAEDRVLAFTEKPSTPKTQWAVPPLYLFPRATLARVGKYLSQGGSPEAPGNFIEWLCRREPVFAYRIAGSILDIGTPQSLESARRLFGGFVGRVP